MPSDFGDESGEKLFDWMLKIGQDAGEAAMLASAERLKAAFKNARGALSKDGQDAASLDDSWAKLKLTEFEELPEYATIKEAIDAKLNSEAIEHDFFTDSTGHEFLLFKLKFAPHVTRAFEELEGNTQTICERIVNERMLEDKAYAQHAKGVDLDAPATEKQQGYIASLREKGLIPDEEFAQTKEDVPTIGEANKLLNKYGHFLRLNKDEPLSERADRARAAAKDIAHTQEKTHEIELSQARAK